MVMPAVVLALALGGGFSPGADYNLVRDEGTDLVKRQTINFTGAGVSCTDSGGVTTCNITSGGGGGNFTEQSVVLSNGAGVYSLVATGLAWVTATSRVVCSVFGTTADSLTPEAIAAAGLTVSVSDRVAATGFTIYLNSPYGLNGTVRVHCTGD